ncbi:hypothetical protein DPEC_G00037380 [Dallia pectoralis]|uniref:Uncharacterized protein n=1 Tax=Dallia pectoralis TaxID=75939 RepID=A0ACC2HDX3_DALPE|nr:hypothetical protein DPEC_G00037380 [Dallia pectoralis]
MVKKWTRLARNYSLGAPSSPCPTPADGPLPVPYDTSSSTASGKGPPACLSLASSSGSYQGKLEEHMLGGPGLCVEPLFSQQQNKGRLGKEAQVALKGGKVTPALGGWPAPLGRGREGKTVIQQPPPPTVAHLCLVTWSESM